LAHLRKDNRMLREERVKITAAGLSDRRTLMPVRSSQPKGGEMR
jgi:hypothetical protein